MVEEKRLKPWQAALGGVVGMVGGMILALIISVAGTFLVMAVTDKDLLAATTYWPSLAIAVVGTGFALTLFAVAPPLLARVPLRDALGLRGAHPVAFLVAPIGVLSLSTVGDLLMQAAKAIAPWATFGTLDILKQAFTDAPMWLIVPIVALTPGFSEELFFRGMVQRGLDGEDPWQRAAAIIISGGTFAAYHLDPHHVVGVLPLGLYLAWVAARTRSTLVTMFAHAVNNAVAVLAPRLVGEDPSKDEPMPWWGALIGLAIAALTVAAIVWVTRPKQNLPGVETSTVP